MRRLYFFIDFLEVATAKQSLDQLGTVAYDCVFLLENGRFVESSCEAIKLLNNFLQLLIGYKLLPILVNMEAIW